MYLSHDFMHSMSEALKMKTIVNASNKIRIKIAFPWCKGLACATISGIFNKSDLPLCHEGVSISPYAV
jgi:hypothetical protein